MCPRPPELHMQAFADVTPLSAGHHLSVIHKTVIKINQLYDVTTCEGWLGWGTKTTWLGLGRDRGLASNIYFESLLSWLQLMVVIVWRNPCWLSAGNKKPTGFKFRCLVEPSINPDLLPLWIRLEQHHPYDRCQRALCRMLFCVICMHSCFCSC